MSPREMLVEMIGEYARHMGHHRSLARTDRRSHLPVCPPAQEDQHMRQVVTTSSVFKCSGLLRLPCAANRNYEAGATRERD